MAGRCICSKTSETSLLYTRGEGIKQDGRTDGLSAIQIDVTLGFTARRRRRAPPTKRRNDNAA